MAFTTVVTHSTGDVLPAADWNTYVRDNLAYLHGDAGAIQLNNALTLPSNSMGVGANAVGAGAAAGVHIDPAGFINISRASNPLTFTQPGDTNYRAFFDMNGRVTWGDGTNVGDATFGRVAAGQVLIASPTTGLGNYLGGYGSIAPGGPATVTPNANSVFYRIAPINSSGTFTIAAPANPPGANQSGFFFLCLHNSSGSAVTFSWNAIYQNTLAAPGVGSGILALVVYNPGVSKWEIMQSVVE